MKCIAECLTCTEFVLPVDEKCQLDSIANLMNINYKYISSKYQQIITKKLITTFLQKKKQIIRTKKPNKQNLF